MSSLEYSAFQALGNQVQFSYLDLERHCCTLRVDIFLYECDVGM